MKQYIIFIKNAGNPIVHLSPEQQQAHVAKVGGFIHQQVEAGSMKAAQPLEMEGVLLQHQGSHFSEAAFDLEKEVISGYYLIEAAHLEEAVKIAKSDPRFEDGDWSMEIRPIMNVAGIN